MRVKKPIFVIGAGRSGSTVFHRALSRHPNLAWLSGVCDRYPTRPFLNRLLMQAVNYPLLGKVLRKRFNPGECYLFWETYFDGFRHTCRDLLAEDVTPKTKDQIQLVLSQMLTKRRNRLLVKITGWPRVGFLREIFPDAKFVHLVRDGRAVANSLINSGFWWGWRGPQSWRFGELNEKEKMEWERSNKSFICLAGIEWKKVLDRINKVREISSTNSFLEMKYEDLCSEPIYFFRKIIDFCELNWTDQFEHAVRSHTFENTNYKWKIELTDPQQIVLENTIYSYLKNYGYL